ncbi:uncharacterized protein ACNS7B_001792 isoform 2-T2 [Menidia menidia]
MRTLILVLLLVYVSAGPLPGAGTRSGSRARFRSSSGSSPLANNGSSTSRVLVQVLGQNSSSSLDQRSVGKRPGGTQNGPEPDQNRTGTVFLEGPIPEPIRRAVFCGGPRPEMDITGAIIFRRPKVDQNSTGIMIFSNGSQPDSNISRMAFSNGSQPDSNISRMAFSNGSQPDSNISRMILKGPIPEQDTITGAGFFRPPPPPGGCFLGTCALAKLGEDLQSGGDESAGDLTKHAFGPGK